MAQKIDGIQPPFIPIGGLNGLQAHKPVLPLEGTPFRDLLNTKIEEGKLLRFSAHAQTRMNSRNMDMSEAQFEKLNNAVLDAKAKGGHDSLILMDNYAFIVNTHKNTVITAMDKKSLDAKVFTNIDSAVWVETTENAK